MHYNVMRDSFFLYPGTTRLQKAQIADEAALYAYRELIYIRPHHGRENRRVSKIRKFMSDGPFGTARWHAYSRDSLSFSLCLPLPLFLILSFSCVLSLSVSVSAEALGLAFLGV